MKPLCHRCGNILIEDASFCAQCGAPQLRFTPPDPDVPPGGSLEEGRAGAHPRVLGVERHAEIQWKAAIQIAALVSLGVGVLSSILAVGSLLWVLGGAVLVIFLYRRRVPYAVLQPRLGARIGVVTGALTAAIAVAGNTILLLVQRYGLHQGKLLDETLSNTVQQAMSRAATGTEAQAQMASAVSLLLSPEGRAGMVLLGMAFIALIILILSIAGGVLGVQIYRNRSDAHPIH
ncbi:MAG TPA: zinc ribbon domain-containing protein [Acidobacteriaceae bacterium]|nr:zinc ribbon domain-containing protein [Acidobacteriaceae bacterium]